MASKKWKKRLKRIGKVAAIAGAAALAGKLASKRRAGAMSGLTTVPDSQKEAISRAVTGTEYPGANVVPVEKPAVTTGGAYLSRMGGAGNRATQIANQKKRAALNLRAPTNVMGPFDYMQPRVPPGGMRRFKHGGSVTGAAKRGFGRALMKGKK